MNYINTDDEFGKKTDRQTYVRRIINQYIQKKERLHSKVKKQMLIHF